jgi:hypothetical protein
MDVENAKKIILNAVETTKSGWSTWGVHWSEINDVFLGRAYDQLGFDNWIFVTDLKNNNLSIDKIGSILDQGNFERKYDREIAGSLTGPLYILMKKGVFGEEGVNFYKSVEEFDGRKGAAFYKLLWQMLVSCNYLKTHYHADFQVYLKTKYAKYKNSTDVSEDEFLSMSEDEWDEFKNTRPWDELYGVGLNVFDYIMGDVEELKFVKDSYKLDSANQRFLTVTGIFDCRPKELSHEDVVEYLTKLDLPYTLREINKGLYSYCSKLGCDKYCFCRDPRRCDECKVDDICERDFDKLKKVPSWVGKNPEDMTSEEKKEYEQRLRDKFTWQEGDLVKVGWEPLTEEEKELVKALNKKEEEDNV